MIALPVESVPQQLSRERVRISTRTEATITGELAYVSDHPAFLAAVVCPHPHMGGSMENNLVTALATRLAEAGAATLRFDYRAVGESEGSRLKLHESLAQFWRTGRAPEDPQMIQDAAAAIGWLRSQLDAPLVVIGYSFGAWAAVEALLEMPLLPAALVLISPTVAKHDFARLDETPVSTLVIYSDNDFATPAERTRAWIAGLKHPVMEKCFCGAEHFFRGSEQAVSEACAEFFRAVLTRTEALHD